MRPLSRVANPANTLYYEENVGRFAWMRDPDQCPWADGVPGRVKGWHGVWWRFDATFCDGHAEGIKMDGYKSPQLSHYPVGQDGTPSSYETLQCIIVRGENWQKDTLPAATVWTTQSCPQTGRPSQEGPDGVGG
jgi:hypothetical protein